MSIFDDDSNDVRESIRFFNQLPDEEKIRVLSDLNPFIFQQRREYQPLFPLLSKLQQDISKYNTITLGKKLMEYGLDETHAHLFVLNVKKHAPTVEYQMKQADLISDDDFCKKLPGIINDAWINNETYEVLSEKYGIDNEKIDCIIKLLYCRS